MIEINLLPDKYKKREIQLPDLGELKTVPIIIGIVSFLVALYLILTIISTVKSNTLNRLENEWQSISIQQQEAAKLKGEKEKLEQKSDLINSLIAERLLWSKKLNQLSDLMIDGIWLEKLSLGKRKDKDVLILEGDVFSRKKEETALIGEFMQKLRQDKNFFSDFEDVELESIKRRCLGETEVMQFNLVLFLAQRGKDTKAGRE